MGKIIIKMVDNNHYPTDRDIRDLIKYIAGEGKNASQEILLCKGGKGVSENPKKAASQMIAVQRALKKDSSRRIYQIIVSFPKEMHEKKIIKNVANDIAEFFFKKYQVYYGIHTSRQNWHIHFAINSVSYTEKNKWHQSKVEFVALKHEIQDIVEKWN